MSVLHACEVALTTFGAVRRGAPTDPFQPRPFQQYVELARGVLASITPQDFDDEFLVELALNARTLVDSLLIETGATHENEVSLTNSDWLEAHARMERNLRAVMAQALEFKRVRLKKGDPDEVQKALLAGQPASAAD